MSSARRSGRVKGPRAVYTEDPFQAAGISDDEVSGNASASSKPKGARKKDLDEASDAEFVGGSEPDDAEQSDDANASEEAAEAEIENENEDEDDGDDAMDIEEPKDASKAPKKKASSSRAKPTKGARASGIGASATPEVHSRGILDPKDHVSKHMHYMLTFGPDDRDLKATIHTRTRWRFARDIAFPSRYTFNSSQDDSYDYGPTFGISADALARESTTAWDWYYDKMTGKMLRDGQRMDPKLKESEVRSRYLPKPKGETHTVLMGQTDNQQVFNLGYHDVVDIGDAWGDTTARKSDERNESKVREGWLVNCGQRILSMAWAPNQDGDSQYLAVTTPITDEQKGKYNRPESDPVSVFKPTKPYPTAIQIWEFKGRSAGARYSTLDMTSKPRLRQVLCSDWGDLRRIIWCQVPRKWREEDAKNETENLGLLAGVWGDGKVRVLDIKLRRDSQSTEFIKLHSPMFEAKPPSAICTCVAWLSPSDITVGCSNGFVAIWSILPSSEPEPQPYFYHPIHISWVLNITSVYPTSPHLVSTISMDGETRLWSIIDPQSENTGTVRMRSASPHLSYSPVLQAVCSSDENEFGRLMPIRRFFATNSVGKIPSTVSALAPCSWWHPSVMYGGTGGEALATNPFRRMLNPKDGSWQQLWFSHEWTQGRDANGPGVSRFFDGYRAETQSLARNMTGENRPMGLSLTTIHDEGTHVTGLGWNPNRRCAAWASAALGCGLLRVEDLAI